MIKITRKEITDEAFVASETIKISKQIYLAYLAYFLVNLYSILWLNINQWMSKTKKTHSNSCRAKCIFEMEGNGRNHDQII